MKNKVQFRDSIVGAEPASAGRRSIGEDAMLTPRARRHLASAALLAAVDRYIQVVIAERASAEEWVDQETSPLGRRAHLKAVRRGDLKGVKVGRRVLVRRSDLDAFFEAHASRHPAKATDDPRTPEQAAAAALSSVGLRMRAS